MELVPDQLVDEPHRERHNHTGAETDRHRPADTTRDQSAGEDQGDRNRFDEPPIRYLPALDCQRPVRGENRRDIFQRGQEIEGAAERGPCALQFDEKAKAVSLSGDNIAACLRETEKALELYEQAKAKGLDSDPEFVRIYEQAKARKEKLGSMLKQVRMMENEQLVDTR